MVRFRCLSVCVCVFRFSLFLSLFLSLNLSSSSTSSSAFCVPGTVNERVLRNARNIPLDTHILTMVEKRTTEWWKLGCCFFFLFQNKLSFAFFSRLSFFLFVGNTYEGFEEFPQGRATESSSNSFENRKISLCKIERRKSPVKFHQIPPWNSELSMSWDLWGFLKFWGFFKNSFLVVVVFWNFRITIT